MAEKKEVKPIVSGKVTIKEKSAGKKIAGGIISSDAKDVGSYIIEDVLLPAIKKGIFEMVTGGIEMLLYGETGKHSRTSRNGSKVSYRSYYEDRDREPVRYRTGFDTLDDVIFEDRLEAQKVLSELDNMLDTYEAVSIQDFYSLIGKTGRYTDNDYGWNNLRAARIAETRDGWVIKFPRPMSIK